MKFNFKDKELNDILKKLTVIIDTREHKEDKLNKEEEGKKNTHILNYFDKKKIPYVYEKIDYGDYSCKLPSGSFEGQTRDIYFTRDIVIERKNGIDEIAGNLRDAARLNKELAHINKYRIKYFIFVENPTIEDVLIGRSKQDREIITATLEKLKKMDVNLTPYGFDENIRLGNYRSQYNSKAIYSRIKTLEARYNTIVRPVKKDVIASEIYNTLRFHVREILKNENQSIKEW